MIELVFVVCMVASPGNCHSERPSFVAPYPTTQSCMFEGQMLAAEWQQTHPGWIVRRWTCGPPET
ncbi:hypothetical protein [Azospirillum halopraeferens]|uniref:hypothetical protein n=1 Tax=Azospirillum halopraeferens TaxID=34010 RepID=UPI00040A2DF7|nr:hypothetical protein [Azospirillum halopraeferens]